MVPTDDGVNRGMRLGALIAGFDDLVARLFVHSGGVRWNVAESVFRDAICRAVERRFCDSTDGCDRSAVAAFLESIHVEDLALALGCRAGNDAAWREFDARFRPVIDKIACAITRDVVRAREIADSLYGDLYGFARGDGARRSPFDHYHGRSPLAAWLRVVIAQREAESWRVAYRSHRDGAVDSAILSTNHSAPAPDDPDRGRYLTMVSAALRKSIDALPARDKLRLSYYYVQELTLAEVGVLMAEHESTVSRNLTRTRGEIRTSVERGLRKEYRLSDDQISRCFEYATGDWPFDLARTLAQDKPAK